MGISRKTHSVSTVSEVHGVLFLQMGQVDKCCIPLLTVPCTLDVFTEGSSEVPFEQRGQVDEMILCLGAARYLIPAAMLKIYMF